MSDRPRRLTRAPVREAKTVVVVPAPKPRRKPQDVNPTDRLRHLLQNPKSELTTVDISDIINVGSWNMLSQESQSFLSTLLPTTAFHGYQPSVEPQHPSSHDSSDAMEVDSSDPHTPLPLPATLDTSVFTDPHFLAAAHTFQDHIYSNWMSDAHAEKVKNFEQGVCDGKLSAPWKDEVWESNNGPAESTRTEKELVASSMGSDWSARAGQAAEVKLVDLAKHSVVLVGDVIAYRRNFSHLDLIVEKDVIIQSIHPKSRALTVLIEPGSTQHLSPHLLTPNPSDPTPPTQSMTITSPSMLENGLLDIDGRVDKSKRPNGNAWKCFTVWRWNGEPPAFIGQDGRGGRENHGTLFYLRGSYYQDR